MAFTPATRKRVKARLAIGGLSKSGKSLTSLALLRGIVGPEGRIAAIDTENGALSLYAGRFPSVKQPTGFDVQEINHFSPDRYIKAIDEAVRGKYDGLLVDSASHEWVGTGGILEMVDGVADKFFTGWKQATPKHNGFIQAFISAPLHIIVTLRQKAEYIIDTTGGSNAPKKVGMQLVQREGFEYEFNAVGTMDLDHNLRVQWSAIDFLPNGTVIPAFGDMAECLALGGSVRSWLDQGDEDWNPPTFKKAFYVNQKEVISAGIERDTYIQVLNLGAALDKASGKRGAAKEITSKISDKKSLADLNEDEGKQVVSALETALEETKSAHEQAKSA